MAREVSTVNEERDRLLDELLKGKTPDQILGESGLIKHVQVSYLPDTGSPSVVS